MAPAYFYPSPINPQDYDVSPVSGFIPSDPPLEQLGDRYYAPWEQSIHNLQTLKSSGRLHNVIDKMPVLSTRFLTSEAEWKRAYSILSMLAHAYIWNNKPARERVPPSISTPLKQACAHFDLPIVATYAGLCLWNWQPIRENEPYELDNLRVLSTFTGTDDEAWFYIISVGIEAKGGPIVTLAMNAIAAAREGDEETVTQMLFSMADYINDLTFDLSRVYERCAPEVFYKQIRPFFSGSKGVAEAGLPNGVIFDTGSPDDTYVQFSGGSNAQSSLIQFLDIALGVIHQRTSTGISKAYSPPASFIHEMRKYMPGLHRQFLEETSKVANLHEFVEARTGNESLVSSLNACIEGLGGLRNKHLEITSRYVIIQSQKARRAASYASTPDTEPAEGVAAGSKDKASLKGTGGTTLMPFLKQARDETVAGLVKNRDMVVPAVRTSMKVPMKAGLQSPTSVELDDQKTETRLDRSWSTMNGAR